jgi:prefoldin subunit 5
VNDLSELVTTWGDENYRAVDYGRLTAVLIEAVKELKTNQENLEKENQDLRKEIDELKSHTK